MADIPFDKIVAAMLTVATWAQDSVKADSDGGVGITVNESLELVQKVVEAMGFNVTIYNKPEE